MEPVVILLLVAGAFVVYQVVVASREETSESRTIRSLPPSIQHVVAEMDDRSTNAFFNEYERKKKKKSVGWLAWFFLGWHYLYAGKVGVQFAYWFTFAGLGLWAFVDLFRMPSIIRSANERIAREAIQTLGTMATFGRQAEPAGAGAVSPATANAAVAPPPLPSGRRCYVGEPTPIRSIHDTSQESGTMEPGRWYTTDHASGGWAQVVDPASGQRGWVLESSLRFEEATPPPAPEPTPPTQQAAPPDQAMATAPFVAQPVQQEDAAPATGRPSRSSAAAPVRSEPASRAPASGMGRFCSKCGKGFKDEAAFCVGCGAPRR